jgi:uncharacterized membrane protein YfcA
MEAIGFAFLFTSGAAVGFVSGLLGLGGGIIMFPVLLYIPPLIGLEPIGVKSATGLTMAQGFFASLSAVAFYGRHRLVHRPLVLWLGLPLAASSLLGSLISKAAPEGTLLLIFSLLASAAAALMFLPRSYDSDERTEEHVRFSRPIAALVGLPLGFFLGMVGQGGAFIIIPTLLYVLKVPLRVALGSTLAIGLLSATAGIAGKLSTAQVPILPAAVMVLGAVPLAQIGGAVGRRTNVTALRWMLAAVILAAAVKTCTDVF